MTLKQGQIHDCLKLGEDFELDLRAYQLRRAGRVLKLEPTPMELLVFLVEHRGSLLPEIRSFSGYGVRTFSWTRTTASMGPSARSGRSLRTILNDLDSLKLSVGEDIAS